MLAFILALTPRVTQNSPVGRLKKRLLAACRKRFDSGFESLLCPFFHRLSFDPVPERSFPDLTISGVKKNNNVSPTICGPTPDDAVALLMTSGMCSLICALSFDRRRRCFAFDTRETKSCTFVLLLFFSSFKMYAQVTHHPI